jgi:hypothetical protein
MFMKLRCVPLIVAAAALFIPAGFANADPVGDPSVIINRSPSDATPFTGSFNVTLGSDGGADVTFVNALSVDITGLVVQFEVPLPTGVNTCSSTIFATCGVQDISFNTKTGFLTEDFVFGGGGSISPGEEFSFAAAGFVGANPNVTISLPTPEPGTIVLLLTGGLLMIGLGRRW